MEDDDLTAAGRAYLRAKAKADALLDKLKQEIVTAYKAGTGTMEIVRRTGYDRESVRRVLKAAREAGELPPLTGRSSPKTAPPG